MLSIIKNSFPPSNGTWLNVKQNIVAPKAHTSAFLPSIYSISGSQASGGMKWKVPSVWLSIKSSAFLHSLLTPKSEIMQIPWFRRMFWGLMSLWTTPISWSLISPSQIYFPYSLILSSERNSPNIESFLKNLFCLQSQSKTYPPSQ